MSDEQAELALAEALDALARGLRKDREDFFGGRHVRQSNGQVVTLPTWKE